MSRKLLKFFKEKRLFPYLLGIYPILFFFVNNMSFFDLKVLALPLAIIILFSFIFIRLYRSILGTSVKFEIILALTLFYFMSYGHMEVIWGGTGPKGNILTLLFWVITTTILFLAVVFLVRDGKRISLFLNIASSLLVTLAMIQIGLFKITNTSPQMVNTDIDITEVLGISDIVENPNSNIYYIILDGYGRSDVLREIYNFDNTYFINRIKEIGFYVAEKSKSNYGATALSLSSSLNLNYIQDLFEGLDTNSSDRNPLHDLIKKNKVVEFLKEKGYCIEHISSGYYGAEVKDINHSITQKLVLNEFEGAIVGMTPIPSIIRVVSLGKDELTADIHRKTLLDAFDKLEGTTTRTNCFIFAHILLPHPPFVFDQYGGNVEYYESLNGWDGSHLLDLGVTKEEYISHYRNQAIFTTNRILEVINKIASESKTPPIIVLQSDHGPASMLDCEDYKKSNLDERFGIINAYLLPDRNYEGFYQEATPVNSFRLVFNSVFRTNFQLLEDKSYFSTFSHPYLFTYITGLLSDSIE